jgi:hypothetical protein
MMWIVLEELLVKYLSLLEMTALVIADGVSEAQSS